MGCLVHQWYLAVTYSLSSLARTTMILDFFLAKGNLKKDLSYVESVVGFTYVTGPQNKKMENFVKQFCNEYRTFLFIKKEKEIKIIEFISIAFTTFSKTLTIKFKLILTFIQVKEGLK